MNVKNLIHLVGRLTADPELRYTPQGTPVATFALAVNRSVRKPEGGWKDERDGFWKDERDGFFDCELFGGTALTLCDDFKKGCRGPDQRVASPEDLEAERGAGSDGFQDRDPCGVDRGRARGPQVGRRQARTTGTTTRLAPPRVRAGLPRASPVPPLSSPVGSHPRLTETCVEGAVDRLA